jgi:hypothetical protein
MERREVTSGVDADFSANAQLSAESGRETRAADTALVDRVQVNRDRRDPSAAKQSRQ